MCFSGWVDVGCNGCLNGVGGDVDVISSLT